MQLKKEIALLSVLVNATISGLPNEAVAKEPSRDEVTLKASTDTLSPNIAGEKDLSSYSFRILPDGEHGLITVNGATYLVPKNVGELAEKTIDLSRNRENIAERSSEILAESKSNAEEYTSLRTRFIESLKRLTSLDEDIQFLAKGIKSITATISLQTKQVRRLSKLVRQLEEEMVPMYGRQEEELRREIDRLNNQPL